MDPAMELVAEAVDSSPSPPKRGPGRPRKRPRKTSSDHSGRPKGCRGSGKRLTKGVETGLSEECSIEVEQRKFLSDATEPSKGCDLTMDVMEDDAD